MKLKPLNKRGKFIAIYGSNNLGKTTQVKKLAQVLNAAYLKYPLYDLEPNGPLADRILRPKTAADKMYTPEQFQKICAQNRLDYQETLIKRLNSNEIIVAEDYKGTGIAWGMTKDISFKRMLEMNKDLIDPDLAILLYSPTRFVESIEKGHIYEDAGDELWSKNARVYKQLAEKFNWHIVNAKQSIEKVHEDIMKIVNRFLANLV